MPRCISCASVDSGFRSRRARRSTCSSAPTFSMGDLAQRLRKMVGFRKVAAHDYQKLNIEIVRRIVAEHLEGFLEFSRRLLRG